MVLAFTLWIAVISQVSGQPADTSIELISDWRFKPDAENSGLAKGWHTMAYRDDDWARIQPGKCWEEQGFPEVDGYAWYRIRVDVPQAWEGKRTWLAVGAVNDACTLFCNGQRINQYGNEREEGVSESMAAKSFIAELSPWLQYGGENLIAIRCSDWGNKGGLWRLPCALTIDPAELPIGSFVAWSVDIDRRQLHVDVDLAGLGYKRPESTLTVKLFALNDANDATERSQPIAARSLPLGKEDVQASVTFDLQNPQAGQRYRIVTAVLDAQDDPLAGFVPELDAAWPTPPAWPEPYSELKVLNNFVTELINTDMKEGSDTGYSFLNPRDGWVFIGVTTTDTGVPVARIDREDVALVWRTNPDTEAREAMRFLHEGEHTIRIVGISQGNLVIRTVPEIAFCYYPAVPHIRPYGTYDWNYMTRYVLPHVNALVTSGQVAETEFKQWTNEGRQWIANSALPGLGTANAPTVDDVYECWSVNPGMTAPGYAGMIVDEFLAESAAHYAAWTEAVERLHANPGSKERLFYAWCGELFRVPSSTTFLQMLLDRDQRLVWECYLPEEHTVESARRRLAQSLQHEFRGWQTVDPNIARLMVMCLGYLCAPPESLNQDPSVDYHVFMDMQFQLLATDPTFWNLYGIMEYSASYADEESLRWAHQLIRHYCIEGNRTALTQDPYCLPHLVNPDFSDGLSGWDVQPAEKDSVLMDRMEGFSFLQGRYPKTTRGDRFVRLVRSAKQPNTLRQTIQALEPGRLYCLKAISADINEFDKEQLLGLTLSVTGAEIVEEYGFQFPYPSCYAHEIGPFNRNHPAWFNLHRLVFRAKSPTAELEVMDWLDRDTPGGPAGQSIALNFIEVEPFIEP